MLSAVFSGLESDSSDDFQLLVNGNPFFGVDGANVPSVPFIFNPAAGPAQSFGFTVTDGNDNFFLESLEVETVPTPALLPSLLGMGMAALRKRRNEATEAADA